MAPVPSPSPGSTTLADGATAIPEALQRVVKHPTQSLCPDSGVPGMMHCMAVARAMPTGGIQPFATPSGYGPGRPAVRLRLPTSAGSGETVAIVDA